MNKTLRQLIQEAKEFGLSSEERNAGKASLRLFVKTHPLSERGFWYSFRLVMLRPASLSLVLVLLFSVGTALAAESTLPGDTLYPVKVRVNEPIQSWLYFSEQSRADWDALLASRRLEEAEELATQDRLDVTTAKQVEANFQAQIDRTQARIAKFSDSDAKAGADVAINLETSLRVHDRILLNIASSSQGDAKLQIESLLDKVRASTKRAAKDRNREEGEVKIQNKPSVQLAAEGRMPAAQNVISEVDNLIRVKSSQLGVSATTQAKTRLDIATVFFSDGQAKLKIEAYAEAFTLFGQARATAQEAKLLIEAKGRLEKKTETVTTTAPASSPVVTNANGGERENNEGGDNKSGGGFIRNNLKIDLGL